jgi:hypothetical protein
VFHTDIVKVDQDVAYAAMVCTRMLQASVSSQCFICFLDVCYKCVYLDIAYVCNGFQMFFTCFIRMFQVFHLSSFVC